MLSGVAKISTGHYIEREYGQPRLIQFANASDNFRYLSKDLFLNQYLPPKSIYCIIFMAYSFCLPITFRSKLGGISPFSLTVVHGHFTAIFGFLRPHRIVTGVNPSIST